MRGHRVGVVAGVVCGGLSWTLACASGFVAGTSGALSTSRSSLRGPQASLALGARQPPRSGASAGTSAGASSSVCTPLHALGFLGCAAAAALVSRGPGSVGTVQRLRRHHRRQTAAWPTARRVGEAEDGPVVREALQEEWPQLKAIPQRSNMPQKDPTAKLVYYERLSRDEDMLEELNEELLEMARECYETDTKGRDWSLSNYSGGYTSYSSKPALQEYYEVVEELERLFRPHLQSALVRLDESRREQELPRLIMRDCWVNIMGPGTEHEFHVHPGSVISGTYYVQTPKGCPGICWEDPRLDRIVESPVRAGDIIMFEGWLPHRVPTNIEGVDRVSISFNWFPFGTDRYGDGEY
mmetsp:Transcript_40957/g.131726  ORF Transcript_40957/g.131726 Transcript_40957/m.131726 type:complete len:354 (+) Transcript_40957:71-1132(+)